MDLSFVVLTWNSGRYIRACLESLLATIETSGLNCELFIVDNGSTDDTVAILNQYAVDYPQLLKPIFLTKNHGTTVSRNLALRQARGSHVCIMDSDVEIAPGLFPVLFDAFDADPRVGMVVPKIVYPSGAWQKSIDRFPTVTHKINRFLRLRTMEKQEGLAELSSTTRREVDYAISAFWLMKKEILDRVGLLDENIFYAPEDVDYCLRVWKSKYKIVYEPNARVVHHTQEITRGFKFNKAKFEHIKGLLYLFIKHRYFFYFQIIK